ncbi:MAG TPA: hypothetical protein VJ914_05645 [Pseudonocardiaceae bacterium]|nr:hypothetical protein [Pseudonocardiaceae bacterium]
MPANNHQADVSQGERAGRTKVPGGRRVCGYCGDRITADGGYRALLSNSVSGGSDAQVVVACSRDHLEELIRRYR